MDMALVTTTPEGLKRWACITVGTIVMGKECVRCIEPALGRGTTTMLKSNRSSHFITLECARGYDTLVSISISRKHYRHRLPHIHPSPSSQASTLSSSATYTLSSGDLFSLAPLMNPERSPTASTLAFAHLSSPTTYLAPRTGSPSWQA